MTKKRNKALSLINIQKFIFIKKNIYKKKEKNQLATQQLRSETYGNCLPAHRGLSLTALQRSHYLLLTVHSSLQCQLRAVGKFVVGVCQQVALKSDILNPTGSGFLTVSAHFVNKHRTYLQLTELCDVTGEPASSGR